MSDVAIIIPAYNEEDSISLVLSEVPKEFLKNTFVVDNNSNDLTSQAAQSMGANVVFEPEQGYGAACLRGISEVLNLPNINKIVFLDADYSDHPEDMYKLLNKIEEDNLDLVIGSRNLGEAEPGALLPQALFGNWLATKLLKLRFNYEFTDLGPFRVITRSALVKLKMKDRNFGWTMEMQVKALKYGLKVGEVSVKYKKRVGVSKITGTLKGTVMASYKILVTLFRYSLPDAFYQKSLFLKSKSH